MKLLLFKSLTLLILSLPILAEDLANSLGAVDRDPDDKARDAGRKPAAVLDFLGLEPGMTALDVIAARCIELAT